MQVVQTHLTQAQANGVVHMTTFLPVHPRVKPGSIVSLDKSTDRWKVEAQFAVMESAEITRGWGLELPKSQRTER